MNTQTVTIGLEVVRSKGDYVVGSVGVILELDAVKQRARVDWKNSNTTWVSYKAIEPKAIPYEIKYKKGSPNGKYTLL